MKRVFLGLVASVGLSLAVSDTNKTLDYLIQNQKQMEYAYKMKVHERSKYHYEKARVYNQSAVLLASRADDVGAQLFSLRSFNAVAKAFSTGDELDGLNASPEKEISERIAYVRNNKGVRCAPEELGRAEAYYELLTYEQSKERPDNLLVLEVRNKVLSELRNAEDKVNIAMREGLVCYTGKPIQTTEKPTEEEKPVEGPAKVPEQKAQAMESPLKVDARIHFDFDRYTIKKEYLPVLNEVVRIMKENPNAMLRIVGYTDDIGSKEYNDRLALRRTQAVRDYLVSQGVDSSRIEIKAVGKADYIADNRSAIGRFTNRRADFIKIELSNQ